MWDLSSPTRDQTCIPFIGRWVLNHWATRKIPEWFFKNWESSIDIYALPCVRQIASGNLLDRAGSSAWCSGRGVAEGGGVCILMDDSHCQMAETNTILQTVILCREPAWGIPPVAKVMRKEARQKAKAWSAFRGSPWVFLNIYPQKPESAWFYCTVLSTLLPLNGINLGFQLTASCI